GYKTIGQMVYSVLREAILSGAFAPGEWLRQESLAEAIGVSRIPVRTALLQLESEGMITFHPHRGARVRTLTPTQIDEIYRLRTLLEGYAIERACQDVDPERLARLQGLAKKLDRHKQGDEFLDLRVKFYRELYDAERNPLLVEMIDDLRSHVGRFYLGIKFPDRHRHHADLIERIAVGDIEGAKAWLTTHFDHIRKGIRELAAAEEGQQAAKSEADGTGAAEVSRAHTNGKRPAVKRTTAAGAVKRTTAAGAVKRTAAAGRATARQ
ncbi:MAG TPA: GntR family transcriptional regulator, partial [Jatrophihabitans sp.]|nr:GntR family transcriptional regulator [Jatrophihabitans sp.]